jgi:hypothetical protein
MFLNREFDSYLAAIDLASYSSVALMFLQPIISHLPLRKLKFLLFA